jgi:hypothetical protein
MTEEDNLKVPEWKKKIYQKVLRGQIMASCSHNAEWGDCNDFVRPIAFLAAKYCSNEPCTIVVAVPDEKCTSSTIESHYSLYSRGLKAFKSGWIIKLTL